MFTILQSLFRTGEAFFAWTFKRSRKIVPVYRIKNVWDKISEQRQPECFIFFRAAVMRHMR